MAFETWTDISTFVLDQVFGYQSTNKFRGNGKYLKEIVDVLRPGTTRRPKFMWAQTIDYDGGSGTNFTIGETVTGGTSAATGVILYDDRSGTTGTLFVTQVDEDPTPFTDDEGLTESGGSGTTAVVNGTLGTDGIVLRGVGIYDLAGLGMLYGWINGYKFTNLAASDWSYLYIDYSTVGSPAITNANLIDSTTEPQLTLSSSWQNGSDRCIFAVLTDGSSNILEFYQEDNYVKYVKNIIDRAYAVLTTSWVTQSITMPKFTTQARLHTYNYGQTDNITFPTVNPPVTGAHWRPKGATDSTGSMFYGSGGNSENNISLKVLTNTSQQIEIIHDDAVYGPPYLQIQTEGFYLPANI